MRYRLAQWLRWAARWVEGQMPAPTGQILADAQGGIYLTADELEDVREAVWILRDIPKVNALLAYQQVSPILSLRALEWEVSHYQRCELIKGNQPQR